MIFCWLTLLVIVVILLMPLFETIPIDEQEVARIVKDYWSLQLGKCIKASQNHTFLATLAEDSLKQFIVRVTPDPSVTRQKPIELEVKLLEYLRTNHLPVCKSVPTQTSPTQNWLRSESSHIIVVFEYATGEPVNFTEWKWMTDSSHVTGLGRWFAKFHALSKKFVVEYPHLYMEARNWSELHDRILADVPIDKQDIQKSSDPACFGLIHGDVNVSNYFWNSSIGMPHMFDWDQLQLAWFLYDLSAPIWTVITVRQGGNPVDKTPVPHADINQFTEWLISAYEAELGDKVDRAALQRMIGLRRELYKRFCHRAISELPPESPMAQFCKFMNSWLDKEIV